MFGWFRGRRRPSQMLHPLGLPVIVFESGDAITLGNMCEGIFISGGPGSGKTSGPAKEIVRAIFGLRLLGDPAKRAGALALCAKPDEGRRVVELARQAGRAEDVIHITPTSGHRFDILNYELTRIGGSVDAAARRLELLLEQLQRSSGHGSEPVWVEYCGRILRMTIAMVYAATGKCSIQDCYRFLTSAPTTPEQGAGKDADWKKDSFAAQCLNAAANKNAGDLLTGMAFDFWSNEWPRTGERTRSSGFMMILNLLAKLLSGPVAALISGDEPNVFPHQVCQNKIIVLDVPVLTYHESAQLLATAWKIQTQFEVLRREVEFDTPPVLCLQDEMQFFQVPDHDLKVSTVSRQSRLINLCIGQNVPMFMAALGGGPKAEQEFNGWLADMQCWIACQNGCPVTNSLFSKRCGEFREMLFSGKSGNEPYDPVSEMLGISAVRADVSFQESYQPRLRPQELTRLRKGGQGGLVEAFVFRGGARFLSGETHKLVGFRQYASFTTTGISTMSDQNQSGREKPAGYFDGYRKAYNLAVVVCACITKPVEVFLRRRPGAHYFRAQFGVGIVLYAAMYSYLATHMALPKWKHDDVTVVGLLFLVLSILSAGYHRREAMRAFHKGEVRHRQYFGDSVFARWFSDDFAKRWVEPVCCSVAGVGAMVLSPPMGFYLFLVGACLRGNYQEAEKRLDVRVQAYHDAMLEQQEIARRVRR